MIDNEFGGMSWVRIEADKYSLRHPAKKVTHCQIEFDVFNYNNVEGLPC